MSSISVPSALRETYIVDSWPLVELIKGVMIHRMETLVDSAERGETRLLLSEMNLGELFYLTAKRHSQTRAESVLEYVQRLPVEVVPLAAGDAIAAARLKALHNISDADSFCAALAIRNRAPILTGDPDFLNLRELGVLQVDWLGA